MTALPLAGWDSFYVMMGSSAAALTGLTFVVIALAADAQRLSTRGLRTFVTPTIVHFGTVLAMAAFLIVPGHNVMSLTVGIAAVGAAGVIYSVITAMSMSRIGVGYIPVHEDWLWHVILPIVIYSALLAMAFLICLRPEVALCCVAAASTLLLFIGIHNAWDVAVSISMRKHEDPPKAARE